VNNEEGEEEEEEGREEVLGCCQRKWRRKLETFPRGEAGSSRSTTHLGTCRVSGAMA